MSPRRWGGSRSRSTPITDRLALILALVLILAFGLDFQLNHGGVTIFLARKLADLVEFLEFWR